MAAQFSDKDFSDTAAPAAPHWETHRKIFSIPSFFITIQEILFSPTLTFSRLFTGKALFSSFLFGLIGSTLGLVFGTFWQVLISRMGGIFDNPQVAFFLSDLGQLIGAIFVFPVFIAIWLFVSAGLLHLSLMVTGAAKKDFSVTFKVLAYSQGATGLLGVIPICGSIVGVFWGLYIQTIGLTLAHKTTTGRVVLALLLPILLSCFCIIGAIFFVINPGLLSSTSLWQNP